MATFVSVATLVGGIGLFLLAVKLITDGLRVAAGETLRPVSSPAVRPTPARSTPGPNGRRMPARP